MILVTKTPTTQDQAEIVISKVDHKYNLTFVSKNKTFIFDGSLVSFYPDIASLIVNSSDEFKLQWNSEAINDKCGYFSAVWRKRGSLISRFPVSFFVENNETVHLLVKEEVYIDPSVDEQVIEVESGERAESIFARHVPLAEHYAQRATAKRKLIGNINTNDSLAMLEAQLDLITHILLRDENSDECLEALKQSFGSNSTTTIHSIEKLKNTIANQKAHIRSKQKLYFEERGSLENADLSS